MKRKQTCVSMIIFCVLLMVTAARADELAPQVRPLEVYLFNYTSGPIFVSYSAQGTVWDNEFYITSNYDTGDPLEMPANYTPNSIPTREYGFDYADAPSHNVGAKGRNLGRALYKISIGSTYFYLDLRCSGYITGFTVDIDVKYDSNGFSYRRLGTCPGEADPQPWQTITNGDTLRKWELFDGASCASWSEPNPPNTAPFQPTNPTNLVGSEVNNHPRLSWNASTDPPWTTIKYKVRRSINGGAWSVIALNLTNTTYTDNGYTLEGCYDVAYKVSAYTSHPDDSGYSNTVAYIATVSVPPNFSMDVINNNPRFNWNASQGPSGYTVKYKVWRKYRPEDWVVIRSNLTATTYTDYEVINIVKTGIFFYKVNAYVDCGVSSGYTNTASFAGSYFLKRISSDETEGNLPEVFALSPAYPNPFNPTTTIRYGLPDDSRVRLTIYDVTGQKVRTLVQGEQAAGYQSVTWDSTDDRGQPVSSGVYLYRIQAEGYSETRKMVLLR